MTIFRNVSAGHFYLITNFPIHLWSVRTPKSCFGALTVFLLLLARTKYICTWTFVFSLQNKIKNMDILAVGGLHNIHWARNKIPVIIHAFYKSTLNEIKHVTNFCLWITYEIFVYEHINNTSFTSFSPYDIMGVKFTKISHIHSFRVEPSLTEALSIKLTVDIFDIFIA